MNRGIKDLVTLLIFPMMSLPNAFRPSFPFFPCRKVVELPKRRFGIPLDRIGVSRLGNTKG